MRQLVNSWPLEWKNTHEGSGSNNPPFLGFVHTHGQNWVCENGSGSHFWQIPRFSEGDFAKDLCDPGEVAPIFSCGFMRPGEPFLYRRLERFRLESQLPQMQTWCDLSKAAVISRPLLLHLKWFHLLLGWLWVSREPVQPKGSSKDLPMRTSLLGSQVSQMSLNILLVNMFLLIWKGSRCWFINWFNFLFYFLSEQKEVDFLLF